MSDIVKRKRIRSTERRLGEHEAGNGPNGFFSLSCMLSPFILSTIEHLSRGLGLTAKAPGCV
jgi:hypothetical protein